MFTLVKEIRMLLHSFQNLTTSSFRKRKIAESAWLFQGNLNPAPQSKYVVSFKRRHYSKPLIRVSVSSLFMFCLLLYCDSLPMELGKPS